MATKTLQELLEQNLYYYLDVFDITRYTWRGARVLESRAYNGIIRNSVNLSGSAKNKNITLKGCSPSGYILFCAFQWQDGHSFLKSEETDLYVNSANVSYFCDYNSTITSYFGNGTSSNVAFKVYLLADSKSCHYTFDGTTLVKRWQASVNSELTYKNLFSTHDLILGGSAQTYPFSDISVWNFQSLDDIPENLEALLIEISSLVSSDYPVFSPYKIPSSIQDFSAHRADIENVVMHDDYYEQKLLNLPSFVRYNMSLKQMLDYGKKDSFFLYSEGFLNNSLLQVLLWSPLQPDKVFAPISNGSVSELAIFGDAVEAGEVIQYTDFEDNQISLQTYKVGRSYGWAHWDSGASAIYRLHEVKKFLLREFIAPNMKEIYLKKPDGTKVSFEGGRIREYEEIHTSYAGTYLTTTEGIYTKYTWDGGYETEGLIESQRIYYVVEAAGVKVLESEEPNEFFDFYYEQKFTPVYVSASDMNLFLQEASDTTLSAYNPLLLFAPSATAVNGLLSAFKFVGYPAYEFKRNSAVIDVPDLPDIPVVTVPVVENPSVSSGLLHIPSLSGSFGSAFRDGQTVVFIGENRPYYVLSTIHIYDGKKRGFLCFLASVDGLSFCVGLQNNLQNTPYLDEQAGPVWLDEFALSKLSFLPDIYVIQDGKLYYKLNEVYYRWVDSFELNSFEGSWAVEGSFDVRLGTDIAVPVFVLSGSTLLVVDADFMQSEYKEIEGVQA